MNDPFTSYEEIMCRDGVKRCVYPALLKHKDKIRKLTPKFNDIVILDNIFSFAYDDKTNDIAKDDKGETQYVDESWDAMMEILRLAFNEEYTVDEIESFVDLDVARKAFEVFYNISGLKKNNLTQTKA